MILSPALVSGSNIIEDFDSEIFKFLFFNWWFVANIVSSLPLRIFLMKFFALFDLRFKIPTSDLPSLLKQIISQIWLPSLLIISNSSSGKIWKAVRAPPFTVCRSTPGGKIFKPGYLISLLIPNIFKF